MTKPHHHRGDTDMIRKLNRWKLCIEFAAREARTIAIGLVSTAAVFGVGYNHFHTGSLHQETQQRLDRLENTVSNLQNDFHLQPDNDAVGMAKTKTSHEPGSD